MADVVIILWIGYWMYDEHWLQKREKEDVQVSIGFGLVSASGRLGFKGVCKFESSISIIVQ